MVTQSKKRLNRIARQKLSMRKSLWPAVDDDQLWDRQKSDGWLSIPRAMPLILRILDMLAPKGKPVSQTYLDLWCRTFDDAFVIVSKPREMTYYSGFSGERAERTWVSRMAILADLGFIDFRPGTNGLVHYVLLYNPYHVIKRHHQAGRMNESAYNALTERVIEIGADDLDFPLEPTEAKAVARKTRKRSRSKKVGA